MERGTSLQMALASSTINRLVLRLVTTSQPASLPTYSSCSDGNASPEPEGGTPGGTCSLGEPGAPLLGKPLESPQGSSPCSRAARFRPPSNALR